MNVQPLGVTQDAAMNALREYKQHRSVYDKRDWEIERIYRQIARGKTVIAALDAIRRAGLDDNGNPRLAIMRADQTACICDRNDSDKIVLKADWRSRAAEWYFEIPWPNRPPVKESWKNAQALLPRIPPQHRPAAGTLSNYHLLWEADWKDIPRDPYLLKRIGKDAWVVLAAWDLTEVEMSVLRAHQ
jgi:hypothetical protein